MKLYVILDAAICDTVAVAQAISGLDVEYVQLRDFTSNDAEYSATAAAIMSAFEGTPTGFIVGERPHLVPRLGAAGVHIGEKYRDIQTAREEIGQGAVLGVSQFSPEFIAEHLGEDFPVDYLSVGPVWTTVSKADAGAEIGVEASARLVAANPYRSALIGGIKAENLAQLAQSVALLGPMEPLAVVLGEVCRSANPAEAVNRLLAAA